jgi:hypothetical protein
MVEGATDSRATQGSSQGEHKRRDDEKKDIVLVNTPRRLVFRPTRLDDPPTRLDDLPPRLDDPPPRLDDPPHDSIESRIKNINPNPMYLRCPIHP